MRKDAHGGPPSPPTCNCLKYAEKKLVEEGHIYMYCMSNL